MTKIDYNTHKLVRIEDLPDAKYRDWGNGETIEKFIEYFTHLKKVAEDAGAVTSRIEIYVGDGYRDIEAWIPKTPEELERDRIDAEKANSYLEERELKELKRLKEKYETSKV
jgi:hypothetical protein